MCRIKHILKHPCFICGIPMVKNSDLIFFGGCFGFSVSINWAKLIMVHTLKNAICEIIKNFSNRIECQKDKSNVLERNSKKGGDW